MPRIREKNRTRIVAWARSSHTHKSDPRSCAGDAGGRCTFAFHGAAFAFHAHSGGDVAVTEITCTHRHEVAPERWRGGYEVATWRHRGGCVVVRW